MARLFFLLSSWPLAVLHPLGSVLGWLAYLLSPSYRRHVRAHARQAGLGLWQRWQAVAHAGRMVAELPRLWAWPREVPLGARVQWEGAEAVEHALGESRGLLILTPHLGCFEMVAMAYAERFGVRAPMTALYRPARQPWLAQVMIDARIVEAVVKGGVKAWCRRVLVGLLLAQAAAAPQENHDGKTKTCQHTEQAYGIEVILVQAGKKCGLKADFDLPRPA